MIFVFSDHVRDAVQQFHKLPVIRIGMFSSSAADILFFPFAVQQGSARLLAASAKISQAGRMRYFTPTSIGSR